MLLYHVIDGSKTDINFWIILLRRNIYKQNSRQLWMQFSYENSVFSGLIVFCVAVIYVIDIVY